jgi:hypothetical protein
MAEQFDTKPLLKILKNILKYGMKNKKDSKQLLETVNCVLNFGLDNMMKEFSEKKYQENDLNHNDRHRPMSLDLTKNDLYSDNNEDDKEKQDRSIHDILLKQERMQKIIESNKNTLDAFMNKVLEKLEKLCDRMNQLENERSSQILNVKEEKPKENITLEIIEKETREEIVEMDTSASIKEKNQIVNKEESIESDEESVATTVDKVVKEESSDSEEEEEESVAVKEEEEDEEEEEEEEEEEDEGDAAVSISLTSLRRCIMSLWWLLNLLSSRKMTHEERASRVLAASCFVVAVS